MRNSFRQGLISYTKNGVGAPQFLLPAQDPTFITLSVSPTPVLATFAHGPVDYLESFDASVPQAWGPLVPGKDNYLYWDIDLLTSEVTYGITTLQPVVSAVEPAREPDQHWFDLSTNRLKVWSPVLNKWVEKVRLFAGMVENGDTDQLTQLQVGSQVGLDANINTGFIMLDSLLRPLRSSTGEFITTDSRVRVKTTVGTAGVLTSPLNTFLSIRAGESIPAMSAVYFSGEDIVGLASSDPALINVKNPVGIVLDPLALNEVGVMLQAGEVVWDQWDWIGAAGKSLYVDSAGQLTLTRPQGLLAYRVGFVKNRHTVLFNVDAETNPQVYTADAVDLVVAGTTPISVSTATNDIGERVATISLPPAVANAGGYMTAAQASALTSAVTELAVIELDLDDLRTNKANLVHTHDLADIEGFNVTGPSNDEVLVFSNGDWVNQALNFDDRYAPLDHNHDGRYALLAHQHALSDVTGLSAALDGKAARLTNLLSFDRVFTGVDQSGATDVGTGQDLVVALAAKAPLVHTHAIAEVNGLQAALDGKSPVDHTHAISDITNLQNTLNGKAPINHTHEIAEVSGLQAALDDKLDAAEAVETLTDLTDVSEAPPAEDDVLTWDGTAWAPQPLPVADLTVKPLPMVTTTTSATALSFGSAAHHKTHWRSTSATGLTVTVYTDALWTGTQEYWEENFNPSSPGPMPVGGTALFGKHGTGDVTFVPVEGVTINSPESLVISKLNGKAMLVKVGPNEWDLEGNLTAL